MTQYLKHHQSTSWPSLMPACGAHRPARCPRSGSHQPSNPSNIYTVHKCFFVNTLTPVKPEYAGIQVPHILLFNFLIKGSLCNKNTYRLFLSFDFRTFTYLLSVVFRKFSLPSFPTLSVVRYGIYPVIRNPFPPLIKTNMLDPKRFDSDPNFQYDSIPAPHSNCTKF